MVPLAFVLMSRRTTGDYVEMFKSLKSLLGHEPVIGEVVSDFEVALWKAIREVFPQVHHFGCAFHWAQAVLRKIKNMRITVSTQQEQISRLLCLPYLPAREIRGEFEKIKDSASPSLQPLFAYMARVWLDSRYFQPENWSVFRRKIRTNNDVEGNHHAWGSDKVIISKL